MLKKILCLFLILSFVLAGCTKATEDIYSDYYEIKWIKDPNYIPVDTSSDTELDDFYTDSDNSYTDSDNSSSSIEEEKVESKILYVKDFGAKADGITDDGNAIMEAVLNLGNCAPGSKLVFESNKTYFISDLMGISNYALYLSDLNNVTIEGNNTTLLLDKDKSYISMSGCKNVTVKGFNFDLKLRSHFVGTVENINVEDGYFDVVSDRDFGYYNDWNPTNVPFGLKAGSETSRTFIVISKYTMLDKGTLRYRIYADMDEGNLGTGGHVRGLKIGEEIILPVPEVGHFGERMFTLGGNENILFQNLNIWNAREFVWGIWNSKGTITFDNVNSVPPKDEKVCFVSWRDMFHCKSNSASLIWKNCTFKGNGDDIFNLTSNMMYVKKVVSKNEVVCYWPETAGSYGDVAEGEKIVIFDVDTGELIGKTTLKKVVDKNTNRYILADSLPKLKSGENIRFCFDSHSAPNSQVINCDLDGTMRFRGGPVTVSDSKIRLWKMWIEWEGLVEGPLAHDISFNNCAFSPVNDDVFIITCNSPVNKWREGLFRLENISFNNCTGINKRHFQNDLNFREDSVDYIKFSPALTD